MKRKKVSKTQKKDIQKKHPTDTSDCYLIYNVPSGILSRINQTIKVLHR